ncbi:MAG: immunoglobulin domain-containing protein [Candidatus Angelobacter sp.]
MEKISTFSNSSFNYKNNTVISSSAFYGCMAFLVFAGVICAGCGGSRSTAPSPAQNGLAITTQPSSQGARLGQTVTFSVTASVTDGVSYQWSKNGIAINGATEATYTTPPTVTTDNASTFHVTVTNATGSLTSREVQLVLNPPQPGDLRFQQVDSSSILDGYTDTVSTNILGTAVSTWGNYGSPLRFEQAGYCSTAGSPVSCTWFFELFSTPITGVTTTYRSGLLTNFQTDLFALGFDTVVTSANMQTGNNAYAISSIKTTSTSVFSPIATQSLPAADFQFVASQQGQEGHVITALGFNGDLLQYVSYGLTGDHNVYEAQVLSATLATITSQAGTLAQGGYIVTAVGGDPVNGFFVVGTRLQGDAMPRPFKIVNSATEDPSVLFKGGYSIVASVTNADLSNTWVGEK